MGCGASTTKPPSGAPPSGKQGTQPEKAPAAQPEKAPASPGKPTAGDSSKGASDPIYENELKGLGNVLARVAIGKEKQCYAAMCAADKDVEIAVVHAVSGDVFHAVFNEQALSAKKEGAKATWGMLFKLMKNGLRKATIKEAAGNEPMTLTIAVEKGPTVSFQLKAMAKNSVIIHRMFLSPLVQSYEKAKSADDTKHTKIEVEIVTHRVSIAEAEHKMGTIQAETEPLSKSSKQATEDAKAAKEQCDGVRKRIRVLKYALNKDKDPLFPDGPSVYILHTTYSKEHIPRVIPCNRQAMHWIKEKYGGDTSVSPTPTADDADYEAVIKVLERVDEWDFDVFALNKATHGGALFTMTYTLLYKYGLVQHFNMKEEILVNFLQAVESGYHPNPYHNAIHAADVLQITHFIVEAGGLKGAINMTPNDCLACLLSAAIHDYDHPGFNNNFHIRTNAYLAILYNDRSVLENLHLYQIFDLVKTPKYNIFGTLTWEQYKDVRDTMLEMVLSTDMGLHAKIYQTFRRRLTEDKEWTSKEDQRLALSIAIKMADISNCCRPPALYAEWAKRIAAEFYNQGDVEARLSLPISPFMDRRKDKIDFSKGQISFMNYIVIPLFEAGAQLLPKVLFTVDIAKKNKQDLLSGQVGQAVSASVAGGAAAAPAPAAAPAAAAPSPEPKSPKS